jgi:hypothetical protein
MRFAHLSAALVALAVGFGVTAPPAHADPTPPDLIFAWDEGEMSMDMSMEKTTLTVTGTAIHYDRKHSGRDAGIPDGPKSKDAVVKDPKKLADAGSLRSTRFGSSPSRRRKTLRNVLIGDLDLPLGF